MRSNANLKLVASQPPEAVLARRLTEAHEAWLAMCAAPMPHSYFAWLGALERLDAERARVARGSRK